MTEARTVHATRIPRPWSDGRQLVACACPIGADHPPAAMIVPVGGGMFWMKYSTLGADLPRSEDEA